MTNYFKMNNYCKYYGKMVIVTTAIMSDNSKLPGYADFTPEVFCPLANEIHGHIPSMLEYCLHYKYIGNHKTKGIGKTIKI